MSAALAAEVRELLGGRDVAARAGIAIELVTVDADGWPRIAMLSAGEVLARDQQTLALALWPASRTTANLERDGRGLLALVLGGAAQRIRVHARRVADIVLGDGPRAAFEASVDEAACDEVPYARLLGGIAFELTEPEPVLARWRETIEALR